jgi:uncharacterized membrane protein
MEKPYDIASILCSAFYNPPDSCHTLSEVLSHSKEDSLTNPPQPVENSTNFYKMIGIVIIAIILIVYLYKSSGKWIQGVLYGRQYQQVVQKAIREGENEMQNMKIGQ